jgi:hypothetical protein
LVIRGSPFYLITIHDSLHDQEDIFGVLTLKKKPLGAAYLVRKMGGVRAPNGGEKERGEKKKRGKGKKKKEDSLLLLARVLF